MEILKNFYEELDQKYHYSKLDLSELDLKLKELQDEKIMKDNIPKLYLKGPGFKYFEIAEEIGKENEKNKSGNRIVDVN